MDGIGATIKRLVWHSTMAGEIVDNAKDFAERAKRKTDKIKVILILDEDIKSVVPELDQRWKNITTLPGTKGLHWIKPLNICTASYKTYYKCAEEKQHRFVKFEELEVIP